MSPAPTAGPARPRILIFTMTPFAREPRALRQLNALRDLYDVTTAGFGPAVDAETPHIELDPSPALPRWLRVPGIHTGLVVLRQHRLLSRFIPRNRGAYERLKDTSWDLIIAHDVATVPVAARLVSAHGYVVDLHEYAPRQGEESRRWMLEVAPYFRWILRTFVTRARAVTTVGRGIVDEYRDQFGIDAILSVNATPYAPLEPRPSSRPLRLVHSGIPSRARKLEVMIEAVALTDADVTLDLLLIDDDSDYLHELRALAAADERVTIRPPVPYSELVSTLNSYDVGLGMIAPSTFNLAWCLPNKFFDFVQARLGVIVGPSPEMAQYVREYGLGAVADDFTPASLARALSDLDPETVDRWKAASHSAAAELSGERQAEIWQRLVADVLTRTPLSKG
ncbi:glycosyltransferase [Streptomyces sp. AC495_CC817]|uniref:glycosyltransferase n=1 Tax=Streptomyces sp. AC495_CC817 TaxID=2823900 RepID=UPI001C26158C|nr:glycosyltransferase [Streptomyces sp. AC495_CC817]